LERTQLLPPPEPQVKAATRRSGQPWLTETERSAMPAKAVKDARRPARSIDIPRLWRRELRRGPMPVPAPRTHWRTPRASALEPAISTSVDTRLRRTHAPPAARATGVFDRTASRSAGCAQACFQAALMSRRTEL